MDVSPKTLREVEFREKMRGYHPEDVDQFLEGVAAGLEVLQDRLRQAIERAQRAEQAATEAGGNDDALRRTLLLAQRAADLAVQEGREQAARVVSSAEQQAQAMLTEADQRTRAVVSDADQRSKAMLADAERRSHSMLSEAEHNARRGHEDAVVQVRAELAKLEVTRQRLQMDIDAMTRWVGEHRSNLRAALEDALTRVDQIDVAAPPTSGVPYPSEGYTRSAAAAPPADPAAPSAPAAAGLTVSAMPESSPNVRSTSADTTAAWAPRATPAPSVGPAAAPRPAPPLPDVHSWQPDDAQTKGSDDTGESDPYFAELRRAISDRDPLGPAADEDRQTATGGYDS